MMDYSLLKKKHHELILHFESLKEHIAEEEKQISLCREEKHQVSLIESMHSNIHCAVYY